MNASVNGDSYLSIAGLDAAVDAQATQWVVENTRFDDTYELNILVPDSFESYVRIFHPPGIFRASADARSSWRELADRASLVYHSGIQWEKIATLNSDLELVEPDRGRLDVDMFSSIFGVLSQASHSDRLYLAAWDSGDPRLEGAPQFYLMYRMMRLFTADLAGFGTAQQHGSDTELGSPAVNAWWPGDDSWYVSTDIDLMSTYVGASSAVAATLLECLDVEAAEVSLTHVISADGDQIN